MKGFLAPKAVVLDPGALVPAPSIVPPPNRFTHVLRRREPYYVPAKAGRPEGPAGHFAKGTRVVLLGRRGRYGRVADRRGRHVEVELESLEALG
jgi:hypothetical protein